jgi:serine/threonine protein kinase
MVAGHRFDVDERYSLLKPVGHGAYGIVCAALDKKTNKKVAIKKIGNLFGHLTDTKRTLREIKLLTHCNHENVISITDIMRPIKPGTFNEVYLVEDLMDTDLHQIIGSPQALSDDHFQYFLYQLLRGLKYLHSAEVLHRDLKPSNLLVNSNCDLKICDLGLARVSVVETDHEAFMTEYVATRWYRAPEIMLSWKEYTKAVDMWSVGCIMAEMLGRKPLFPGKNSIHQINCLLDVLGTPSEDDIKNIRREKAREYIRQLPKKRKVPWRVLFPNAKSDALDLLEKMLTFNPEKRITVEEALKHPYLAALHDPTDEPSCSSKFNFDFENEELTRERLEVLITDEVARFRPEILGGVTSEGGQGSAGAGPGQLVRRASQTRVDLITDRAESGGAVVPDPSDHTDAMHDDSSEIAPQPAGASLH